MAFNPQIIPATDFYPSVGVGVDLPLSDPAVFKSNYTSTAAIKNNLINWFLTNPGERLDNPNFGGGLRRFLFEQIANDNLDGIEDEIQSDMSTYFPTVLVNKVIVASLPDRNTIRITLKYSITNQNVSDQIEFNFG
jgi:phage baseplate assembly protein W